MRPEIKIEPRYARFDLYLAPWVKRPWPSHILVGGTFAGWDFTLWKSASMGRLSLIVQPWMVRIQVGPLVMVRTLTHA